MGRHAPKKRPVRIPGKPQPDHHTEWGGSALNVSAAELKNVGVCAPSTALALASADATTAAFVVDEVRRAALERIEREAALSVRAVTKESTREKELQILRAWAD